MTAARISLDEAKPEKLFYVVATVVVYREADGRCLILKRDQREKVHPSLWGVPGGKLEHQDLKIDQPTKEQDGVLEFRDAIGDLLKRETREESGVEISNQVISLGAFPFVRPDGIPVLLMRFGAKYTGGEVVPAAGDFTDYAWINSEEAHNYQLIEGVEDEIVATIQAFS